MGFMAENPNNFDPKSPRARHGGIYKVVASHIWLTGLHQQGVDAHWSRRCGPDNNLGPLFVSLSVIVPAGSAVPQLLNVILIDSVFAQLAEVRKALENPFDHSVQHVDARS